MEPRLLGGGGPTILAERSGWTELTPHEELVAFYEELTARSPAVHLWEMGRSTQGRPPREFLDQAIFLLVPQINPDGAEGGEWGIRNNLRGRNARVGIQDRARRHRVGLEAVVREVAYLIEPHRGDLVEQLLAHGIVVEEVLREGEWSLESFRVDSLAVSSTPYEGYVPQRFRTTLQPRILTVPRGSYLVRADQPGAALVFHLLEPEDENSLAITGAFMSEARPGAILPVHRVRELPGFTTTRVSPRPLPAPIPGSHQ